MGSGQTSGRAPGEAGAGQILGNSQQGSPPGPALRAPEEVLEEGVPRLGWGEGLDPEEVLGSYPSEAAASGAQVRRQVISRGGSYRGALLEKVLGQKG